jgi:hypothetical protein
LRNIPTPLVIFDGAPFLFSAFATSHMVHTKRILGLVILGIPCGDLLKTFVSATHRIMLTVAKCNRSCEHIFQMSSRVMTILTLKYWK